MSEENANSFDNLRITFDFLMKNDHIKTARDLVQHYLDHSTSPEKLKNVEKLRKAWNLDLSNLWTKYQSDKANFCDAIVIDYLESCEFFDLSKKLKKKRLGKLPPLHGMNLGTWRMSSLHLGTFQKCQLFVYIFFK